MGTHKSDCLEQKLTDTNFSIWESLFRCMVYKKRIITDGLLTGRPIVVEDGKDSLLLAELMLNVEPHFLATIRAAGTGLATWNALHKLFASRSEARLLQLRRKMNGLKKGHGESVTRFMSRAIELRDELVQVGYDVSDKEVIHTVLSGLPDDYDTIVMTLMCSAVELRQNIHHQTDEDPFFHNISLSYLNSDSTLGAGTSKVTSFWPCKNWLVRHSRTRVHVPASLLPLQCSCTSTNIDHPRPFVASTTCSTTDKTKANSFILVFCNRLHPRANVGSRVSGKGRCKSARSTARTSVAPWTRMFGSTLCLF
jgi:hypothetical protein